MEFTPKQYYTGRVIAPAKFFPSKGDRKPFITFVLSVNNLLVVKTDKGYDRTSAKITCSYTVQNDTDMVATILSRISSDGSEQELGGGSYKSVWVEVEGTERLVQVTDENGNPQKGYYKNLDFCNVNVPDTRLRELYKKEFGESKNYKNRYESQASSNEDQPTLAPSNRKAAPVEEEVAEEKTPVPTFEVGHIEVDPEGNRYEFLGGNSNSMDSWKKLEELKTSFPPFANKNKGSLPKKQTPVSEVLEDDGDLESENLFNNVAKGGKGFAI